MVLRQDFACSPASFSVSGTVKFYLVLESIAIKTVFCFKKFTILSSKKATFHADCSECRTFFRRSCCLCELTCLLCPCWF